MTLRNSDEGNEPTMANTNESSMVTDKTAKLSIASGRAVGRGI